MNRNNIGITLIIFFCIVVVAMVICYLASIGYNAKATYATEKEKIEVQAENSNSHR